MRSTANMVDTHQVALKTHRRCLKSLTIHSVNRLHRPKAPSKGTLISKLSHKLPHNLGPSRLRQMSSLPTTLLTRSNEIPTKITTASMGCKDKVLKVSRRVQHPSNVHIVAIMDLNQKAPHNSHRALLNKASHATQPLERARIAAILLLIQLLKLSSKALAKLALSLSQAIHNSQATTHTAIRTSPARTTLHT